MNDQIIPTGTTETVTDTTINKDILVLTAETDVVISAVVYSFEAVPANAAKVSAFTLKAGRTLFRVRSITFSGTATVIYTRL